MIASYSLLTVATAEQILQVIAHVKTRLQALASPAMPLRALAQVLREPAASAFAHTFAFMFIGSLVMSDHNTARRC